MWIPDAWRLHAGEAPYLVSRYDASTGEMIEINKRSGILDRKLRIVNENVKKMSRNGWNG